MNKWLWRLVEGDELEFQYTNWKGREAIRRCVFESLGVHSPVEDEPPKFVLNGHDLDKNMRRSYRVCHIVPGTVKLLNRTGYCTRDYEDELVRVVREANEKICAAGRGENVDLVASEIVGEVLGRRGGRL